MKLINEKCLEVAAAQEEAASFRDAYLLYRKAAVELDMVIKKFDSLVKPKESEKAKSRLAEVMKRLEQVRVLARKEIGEVADNKRLDKEMTLKDVLTIGDQIVFNWRPEPEKKPAETVYETKEFKLKMSKKQKWDSFKFAVARKSPQLHFADVAGDAEAQQQISYYSHYNNQFEYLDQSDIKWPARILLHGPSAFDRRQFVRVFATEVAEKVVLIEVKAADVLDLGPGKLDDLFQMALDLKPAIVCFEDAEELFKDRNQLDSFEAKVIGSSLRVKITEERYQDICFIASTDRPREFDHANFWRFCNEVFVALPNLKMRAVLIKQHLRKIFTTLTEKEYIFLAGMTKGFSGQDIQIFASNVLSYQARKLNDANYFRICSYRPGVWVPCSKDESGSRKRIWIQLEEEGLKYDYRRCKFAEIRSVLDPSRDRTVDCEDSGFGIVEFLLSCI